MNTRNIFVFGVKFYRQRRRQRQRQRTAARWRWRWIRRASEEFNL